MLRIGEIIDNKYKIVDIIGKGGMGTVYKAVNIKLGNYWAVKELKSRKNLEQEAMILRELRHPGLPMIVDVFKIKDYWYILEEFVEGMPLDKVLAKQNPIEEECIIDWGKQLADILKYLHSQNPRPIIYQDMKPSNIIVNNEGRLKLIDFGISGLYDERGLKTGLGTRGYAAPEQYTTSDKGIDIRTDIYGLGATLYHLATGKPPKEPKNEVKTVMEEDLKISPALSHIIKKCIEINPDDRYQSTVELLLDLENIEGLNKRLRNTNKRIVLRNIIIGAVIFGIINLGIYAYYTHNKYIWDKYYNTIEEGMENQKKGNITLSEKLFNEAVSIKPKESDAYKHIFRLLISQGRFDEALERLMVLKQKNTIKWDAELYHIEGTIYLNIENYDKAIDRYTKALEIDNKFLESKIDLCIALARNKEIERAQSILQSLQEENTQEHILNYLNAEIHLSKNEYKAAIIELEKALSKAGYNERYYKTMAYIYREIKDYDKEIETLLTALEQSHNNNNIILFEMIGDAYQRKADVMEDDGSYLNKSLEYYNRILKLGYETPSIYTKIGRIYRKLRDFSTAQEYLNKALTLNSNYGYGYIQLGYLYIEWENHKKTRKKNYDQAIQYLRTGISMDPDSPEAITAKSILQQLEEGE